MPSKTTKKGWTTRKGKFVPRTSRTMKKVTRKGAYKKNVKAQMVKRRAPIVETKNRIHADISEINGHLAGTDDQRNPLNWKPLIPEDAYTLLPLASFERNVRGLEDYQMIGDSIFSRYLNLKVQIRYPSATQKVSLPVPQSNPVTYYDVPNKIIATPTRLYLICGWVTQAMNFPIKSFPPSLPYAAHQVTQEMLHNYVTSNLQPYFDDDEDKLRFRPKATTNIKVQKYTRIAPNRNAGIAAAPRPGQVWIHDDVPTEVYSIDPTGGLPDSNKTHSWKINRKITLTKGVPQEVTEFPVDNENLFPNDSWIPFAILYNPDYEDQLKNWVPDPNAQDSFLAVQAMQYRYNDAHYYTDS